MSKHDDMMLCTTTADTIYRLKKGSTIEVCVGAEAGLDHILPMPVKLLAYFLPGLAHELTSFGRHIVVIPHHTRATVAWVLRWMLAGGIHDHKAILAEAPQKLLVQYQMILELNIGGKLKEALTKQIVNHVIVGKTHVREMLWVFDGRFTMQTEDLRNRLCNYYVHAALAGTEKSLPANNDDLAPFNSQIASILATKVWVIKKVQVDQKKPLPTSVIAFIYAFTKPEDYIRRTLCRDLLTLLDDGIVSDDDAQPYFDLSCKIPEFYQDMSGAMEAAQQYRDRVAKRVARAEATALRNQRKAEYLEREARRAAKSLAQNSKKNQVAAKSSVAKDKKETKVPAVPVKPVVVKPYTKAVVLTLTKDGGLAAASS